MRTKCGVKQQRGFTKKKNVYQVSDLLAIASNTMKCHVAVIRKMDDFYFAVFHYTPSDIMDWPNVQDELKTGRCLLALYIW